MKGDKFVVLLKFDNEEDMAKTIYLIQEKGFDIQNTNYNSLTAEINDNNGKIWEKVQILCNEPFKSKVWSFTLFIGEKGEM